MVLSRSFLVDVPTNDSQPPELEHLLMLLPVGDLFNHGAQSLSRTRYNAETDTITIVTKTAFHKGEEVVSICTSTMRSRTIVCAERTDKVLICPRARADD